MNQPFWTALAFVLIGGVGFNLLRYALLAGGAHRILHSQPPTWGQRRKISPRRTTANQVQRDIKYSMLSIGVFGLVTISVFLCSRMGWTQVYPEVADYGWLWAAVSIPVMLIIHDTYFYWTHRLMHHPRIFGPVHKVHHLSRDPTPLTSYAFHPFEAVIEAGIVPVLAFTLPVHSYALLLFATLQFAYNVLGHLGYEFFPRWFIRSPLAMIFNSATHHHQHHQKVKCNYGLYFNWWDRLMKTNHIEYEATFEKNTRRSVASES